MKLLIRHRVVVVLAVCLVYIGVVSAAVSDVAITDVTPRAFSLVWASSEPVTTVAVRVYTDASGTNDITASLSPVLVSEAFPPALSQGIVKVDITGLAPNTRVYVRTTTTGASGTVFFPAAPPYLEARTAVAAGKANTLEQFIVNDLLQHQVLGPDTVSPTSGTLVVITAPGLGAYPLSAFIGEGGFTLSTAVVDLNNLFTTAGVNVNVAAGQVLTVKEFRGLLCPGLNNQALLRFRRVPARTETPAITKLETPVPCYFADTVCDDVINILDAQSVLNVFGAQTGQCVFNPDMDVVKDNAVNILDVQSVLNFFGRRAPF